MHDPLKKLRMPEYPGLRAAGETPDRVSGRVSGRSARRYVKRACRRSRLHAQVVGVRV